MYNLHVRCYCEFQALGLLCHQVVSRAARKGVLKEAADWLKLAWYSPTCTVRNTPALATRCTYHTFKLLAALERSSNLVGDACALTNLSASDYLV